MTYLVRRTLPFALAALLLQGCQTTKAGQRYSREQAAATLKQMEKLGLEIGEFPINGAQSVIDGDTIRVKGLNSSLRLLAIDTEETFKHDSERKAFARGWESYLKEMKGNSPRPVKMATPMGEEAKHWAQAFFEGVTSVRLERDHPGEIRDYYGRYLAYVFVKKGDAWVNYNLEACRAGMAPYFTKYGRSRRFDKEFEEAQAQAKAAQLGIWNPNTLHYPDYDERLTWWNKRADVITRFEREAKDNPDYIVLTRWDSVFQLEQHLGKQVTLLGSVNEVRMGDSGPTVVKLGRTRTNNFDVVFFDKDVFLASGIQAAEGEYVRVRGVVQKYMDHHHNVERLQIVVSLPGQVLAPSEQLDEMLGPPPSQDASPPPADGSEGNVSKVKFTSPPPLEQDGD